MSRICDLTDKKAQSGNNVSHSNRKSRRKFKVNLHRVSLFSEALGARVPLKLAASTLRTIDFKGGLDSFLVNTKNNKLSGNAIKLKKKIQKAITEKEVTN